MSYKSKSFYVDVSKGANFGAVTDAISRDIGVEGDYIKVIEAVSLGNGDVQLTLYYRTQNKTSVLGFSPPPGAVVPSGTDINHASILFSDRIDAARLVSGSFSFDGSGIATGLYVESGNYIVRVLLPPGARTGGGYHSLEINSDKLYYQNSNNIQHSAIVAYNINAKASPQPGMSVPYTFDLGRRGLIAIEGILSDKNYLPADRINQFLTQKGLTSDRLIAATSVDVSIDKVYIFFVYFKTLEPQLLYAYPYVYSLAIDTAAPREIVFVFREPLDRNYTLNTLGLFKLVTSYNTETNIPLNKISVDSDGRSVRITTSGVITSAGIYDFRIGPLRSADGSISTRDIIYSIQVFPYTIDGGSVIIAGGSTGITGVAGGLVFEDVDRKIIKVSGDDTIIVSSDHISVGTIYNNNIANNTISGGKIANGQVVRSTIINGSSLYDNITLTGAGSVTVFNNSNTVTISGNYGTGAGGGAGTGIGYITSGNETATLPNSIRLSTDFTVTAQQLFINEGQLDHNSLANLNVGDPHTGYIRKSIGTTKGDLIVASGAGDLYRLGVGSNNFILTADNTAPYGMAWKEQTGTVGGITGEYVQSFNGRTGIVTGQNNDYYFDQINTTGIFQDIGDLVVGSGIGTGRRFPVGFEGQVLTSRLSDPLKVRWEYMSSFGLVEEAGDLTDFLLPSGSVQHSQVLVYNSGAVSSNVTGQWMNTSLLFSGGLTAIYNTGANAFIINAFTAIQDSRRYTLFMM